MKGIHPRIVRRKFELWAKEFGLEVSSWENGKVKIGSVNLDHYHGWHVEQHTSEGGGVRVLNEWRMNNAEMCAWFEGTHWVVYHANKAQLLK